MKVTNLASALRAEVSKLAAREVEKGLRQVRSLQRQLKKLRAAARTSRRTLRSVERNVLRIESRVPAGGVRRGKGARMTGEEIRSLRSRLGMTREQFAKVLDVSPGSIFGWETGRTVPRGRSMDRVIEVKKMGVRRAQAAAGTGGGRGSRRRGGRRKAA